MDELILKHKFIDLFCIIEKFGQIAKCESYEVEDIFYMVDENIDIDQYFDNFESYVNANKSSIENQSVEAWLRNLTLSDISEKDIAVYELPTHPIKINYGDNVESFVRSLYSAAVEFMSHAVPLVKPNDNIKLQYNFDEDGIFIGFYADDSQYTLVYPQDRYARRQLASLPITKLTKAYSNMLEKADKIGVSYDKLDDSTFTEENKETVINFIMDLQKQVEYKNKILHKEMLDSLSEEELTKELDKEDIENEKNEQLMVTVNEDGEDVIKRKKLLYNEKTYKQLKNLFNEYINVPFNALKREFNSAQGTNVNISSQTYAHIHDNIVSTQECILYISTDSFGYSGKGNNKEILTKFIKQFFSIVNESYSKFI